MSFGAETQAKPTILFCGDPHGRLQHIVPAVLEHRPAAIILLGDIMAEHPLELELRQILDLTVVWWIPGNHDTDNEKFYNNLFNSGLADRNLHGRVVEIAGLRIAGLGGVFRNKLWNSDASSSPADYLAMCGQGNHWRGGLPLKHRSTVFRSEVEELASQKADVLVTHEAPGMHPHGRREVTDLAKQMCVTSAFHGHLHEDIEYDDGVWRGVAERAIFVLDVSSFGAETRMLNKARSRILSSQAWITADRLDGSLLAAWKNEGRIFAINNDGVDLYPNYGLEANPARPLPAMKQVLESFSLRDPWEIAFWFDSASSYLDGRRPQDLIATEPDKVVAAAIEEKNWEANG
jgi:predicted phosphodiesterase